jgi:protoheme ferro-lyase
LSQVYTSGYQSELSNELVHLHLYPLDSSTTTYVKNFVYSLKKKNDKKHKYKSIPIKKAQRHILHLCHVLKNKKHSQNTLINKAHGC